MNISAMARILHPGVAVQNNLARVNSAPQPTPSVSVNLSGLALRLHNEAQAEAQARAHVGYPSPGAMNTPGLSGYPAVTGHVPGAPHLEYSGDNGVCVGALVAALGSLPSLAKNPTATGLLSWGTGAAVGIAGGCLKVVPDAGHGGDGHGVNHSQSTGHVTCSAPHDANTPSGGMGPCGSSDGGGGEGGEGGGGEGGGGGGGEGGGGD